MSHAKRDADKGAANEGRDPKTGNRAATGSMAHRFEGKRDVLLGVCFLHSWGYPNSTPEDMCFLLRGYMLSTPRDMRLLPLGIPAFYP